jgi:hypothetical protein
VKINHLPAIEQALAVLQGRHSLGQYSIAVDTLTEHLPRLISDYKRLKLEEVQEFGDCVKG